MHGAAGLQAAVELAQPLACGAVAAVRGCPPPQACSRVQVLETMHQRHMQLRLHGSTGDEDAAKGFAVSGC